MESVAACAIDETSKYACIKSPHVLPDSRARGDVALTPKHRIWPNNIGGASTSPPVTPCNFLDHDPGVSKFVRQPYKQQKT